MLINFCGQQYCLYTKITMARLKHLAINGAILTVYFRIFWGFY